MKWVFSLVMAVAAGCAGPETSFVPVKRAEVIELAQAYASMEWTGSRDNILHGNDPQGIRVDTPDQTVLPRTEHAFWPPGVRVQGMPYQWGGFDLPGEFIAKLSSSPGDGMRAYAAGDIATAAKRAGGDAAVSKYAAGIDCSGFVSRCWRLARPYSTRELGALCDRLPDAHGMAAGDILLLPGVHVVLFKTWVDEQRTLFLGIEAGYSPMWRVNERVLPLNSYLKAGYAPYRYQMIRE